MVTDPIQGDGGAGALTLEVEEREVLLLALDRYLTALAALRVLGPGAATSNDRLEAIAILLRERLDRIGPDRGHFRSQTGEQVTAESLLTDIGPSITPVRGAN